MTVKKVVNQSGPQTTNSHRVPVHYHKPGTLSEDCLSHTAQFPLPSGISERLSSMEAHVKLSSGKL